MKPLLDRISPRSIRALYLMFALVVLLVTGYNALHVMLWRVPSNDQCEWKQTFSDSTFVHMDKIKPGMTARIMAPPVFVPYFNRPSLASRRSSTSSF